MADSAAFTRIYELKLAGVDKLLADINNVIAGLYRIGQAKNNVSGQFVDSAPVSEFNKQINLLVQNIDKVVAATEKNSDAQTKLADSIGDVINMQKNVTMNMQETAQSMGANLTTASAGLAKMQGAFAETQQQATDYLTTLYSLSEQLTELKAQLESSEKYMNGLNSSYKNNIITTEVYNERIANQAVIHQSLKTQISEVTAAMTTLNKSYNPALTQEQAQQVQAGKVAMSEYNIELKQQAKLLMATEGSIDEYSIKLGQMRDKYRQLSEAERESASGRMMLIEIQKLDAQVKELDKSIGSSQRNVGNYGSAFDNVGSKLQNFIVRDLFRATAGFVVFNLIFEGAQKLWDMIPDKIDKSAEAMRQFNDVLTKQLDEFIELQKAQNDYFFSGEDAYKVMAESVKAKGVVDGEVYKAQQEQFEAEQKMREKQLNDLGAIANKYREVEDIFLHYDKYGDLNNVYDQLGKLGLSPQEMKEWKTQISEFFEARSKLSKKDQENYKLSQNTDLFKKQAQIQKETYEKEAEIENSKVSFQARLNELTYSKNIELNQELIQLKEQFRQMNEKRDIESVDKIVNDTKAKYTLLINEIKRKEDELAKRYPDHQLPEPLKNAFDNIKSTLKLEMSADTKNQIEEFLHASSLISLTNKTLESRSNADILNNKASNGGATYEDMSAALAAQVDAKKKAVELEFVNLTNTYVKNGDDITEIQRLRDEKLKQLDDEMYKGRLALAGQFFRKLTQNVNESFDNLIKELDIKQLDAITKVLNGGGSEGDKQEKINKLAQQAIIDKSKLQLEQYQQQLPDAKKVVSQDEEAVKNAKSTEEYDAAVKQLNKDLAVLRDLEHNIAQENNNIAVATDNLANVDSQRKKKIMGEFADFLQESANRMMEELAKEDAYRAEMAQRSLNWNKKVMDSEVQSKNQSIANERAYQLAQEQIQREKAMQEKKRAEQQVELNYAVALMKAFTEGDTFFDKIANAAAATATFVDAEMEISKAPAYADGTSSHPGGLAWIGDGGEPELVKIGNRYAVSPSSPTLVNLPANASVTPFSHIHNIGSNLGANLKAPNYNVSSTSTSRNVNVVNPDIAHLTGLVEKLTSHVQNITVSMDTHQAATAMKNNFYKKVAL